MYLYRFLVEFWPNLNTKTVLNIWWTASEAVDSAGNVPEQHDRQMILPALVAKGKVIELWHVSWSISRRISARYAQYNEWKTHVGRARSHLKGPKPIWTDFFGKFRSFTGLYLWNGLADFGSVNCVGKIFSRAWRKVLSDFRFDS